MSVIDRFDGALAGEGRRLMGIAAVLAVVPLLVHTSSYYSRSAVVFLLFALLAVSLNLVFGHTEQLFLFVGGLAGVGAYTTAILADLAGVSAWLTLPVAVILCGSIGALVSWVSAKRRFNVILIAILTLNLQLIFHALFIGDPGGLTGGSTGRRFNGLALETVADVVGVNRYVVIYYLLLALLVAVLATYIRLINSKYGIAFDAIREDELAASSIGINVIRYKTIAGTLAAVLIGIVGVMFAQYRHLILPNMYEFLTIDVTVLIMLILGGLRTTYGPVVGAGLLVFINRVLFEVLLGGLGQLQTELFGVLLIVLFLYFRQGVLQAAVAWLDGLDVEFLRLTGN